MPHPTNRHPDRDRIFFAALKTGVAVAEACARAGYARRAVYKWRARDDAFAGEWAAAMIVALDRLEAEADRRAVEGEKIRIRHKGKVVGMRRRYSDGLLLARLKAIAPEKYRDHPPAKPLERYVFARPVVRRGEGA